MKRAIYPGSFDPITNGHIDILLRSLKVFDEVIILIANNPNKKSRFTIEERVQMTKEATKDIKNVKVDFTNGLTVDYARSVNSKYLIRGLRTVTDFKYEYDLAEKYHQIDPSIELVFFMADEDYSQISSTRVDEMFHSKLNIKDCVPDSVVKMYEKK